MRRLAIAVAALVMFAGAAEHRRTTFDDSTLLGRGRSRTDRRGPNGFFHDRSGRDASGGSRWTDQPAGDAGGVVDATVDIAVTTTTPASTTTTAASALITTTTTTAPAPTTTAPGPAPTTTTTSASTTTTTTSATTTTTTTSTPSVPPASTSAMPNASNTGVPAGTTLRPSSGFTVTTPGQVIDGLDVTGCITVKANDVVIRRTRLRGACSTGTIGADSQSGLLIEDVEVDGQSRNAFASGISGSSFTCRRCHVHDVGQGLHVFSDVTIESSYVHDLYGEGDPATTGSHNEPVFAGGGSNLVIRNNELMGNFNSATRGGGMSASIALYGWQASQRNVLVEGNRLNGGSYCLYGGATHTNTSTSDVRILNNRFGRSLYRSCGLYGPVVAFTRTDPGNQWIGNVWDDTGAAVSGG